MARRTKWLWPIQPLRSGSRGNIQYEVPDAVEDGQFVSLTLDRTIGETTYESREHFYIPTEANLATFQRAFPESSIGNPDWKAVSEYRFRVGYEMSCNREIREIIRDVEFSLQEDRRLPVSEIPRLIRQIEEEVEVLECFRCKVVDLRVLHFGRKLSYPWLHWLNQVPEYADPVRVECKSDCYLGGFISMGTSLRIYCDALREVSTFETMSREDWIEIDHRLDELGKVVRELLPTSIAIRTTTEFCKYSSESSLWLRFLAGISWQADSPIEAAERCWPVARENPAEDEQKVEEWSYELLMRKPTGIRAYDDYIDIEVRQKNAVAPHPEEWLGNPPDDYFQFTLKRFLQRSLRVCRWLMDRLRKWQADGASETGAAQSPFIANPQNADASLAEIGKDAVSLDVTPIHVECLRVLMSLKALGPESRKIRAEVAKKIDRYWCEANISAVIAELARWGWVDSKVGRPGKASKSGIFITELGIAELKERTKSPKTKAKRASGRGLK